MHCPSCNSENPEGKKFCGECGSLLAHRCANCGAENPPRFKFCGECGASLTQGEKAKGGKGETGKDSGPQTPDAGLSAAERRQLTVMFCDLVGSTALSERLDPEEYREVVRAYQQTSATIIERFGGHIAQYLGDGLLVYFGYPVAHEDDAVRAVRAGLEIIAAIQKQVPSSLVGAPFIPPSPPQGEGSTSSASAGEDSVVAQSHDSPHLSPLSFGEREFPPLQVRIGIHTGLVVIGEIGSSEKREMLALGETPNLAARIQGQANPDEVIISAATYRLVEGLFECEDRGCPELKGVATPLTLYRVVKEEEAQSRFQVVVRKGLTPLIGREHEYGLLQERWARVKEGEGQVVLISGEPGIGKSRLVEALKASVALEGSLCLELRCSPYAQNSALSPVIEHVQRMLGFRSEDNPKEKLRKLLVGAYGRTSLQTEVMPLLAALLSLPHPDEYPPLTLSPQKQKEKTHEALVAWLCEEAKQQAVMYVWEDLHWADPSTLELLTLFLNQVPTTRLLAVLTFRPEFTPPWGAHSYLSQLTLSRLGRSHVETMVEKVTGSKVLPKEIVQQIVSKTDGVPLFVEELTKTVLESVESRESQRGTALQAISIPATLQDSLMARLDRLGAAKEIAQVGATIGREFHYELLQAVSLLSEQALQQGLRRLVEAELVYQNGLPPQALYLFKHALIQDTAYQSLLKSKRQQYHRQIATTLEAQFPQTVETHPELVAHHYTEAGLKEQALPYWQKAGQRASQRSAHAEAIAHLTKGLELLKTLPDTPERTQQELTLQIAVGIPLMATKGFAAPEVERVYARALELCKQVGDTPQLFPALWGSWIFSNLRGELQTSRELAARLLSLAQNAHDTALLLEAHHALWFTSLLCGELTAARAHSEQGIALYDRQQHHSLALLYGGHDPGVCCRDAGTIVLWLLGYPDQAYTRSQEALALARELSHPFSLAEALNYTTWLFQFRREEQTCRERTESLMVLSEEQGFSHPLAQGTLLQGWALVWQGQGEKGIAQMRQGLTALRATGTGTLQPYYLALLAEAYGKTGWPEEGLTLLVEALEAVNDNRGARFYEAELYRLKGTLTLQKSSVISHQLSVTDPRPLTPDPQAEAEACFFKAIEVARKQQAKSLELRAATSLARLWQQQGKKAEAHKILADVYNWFSEGFDTKDLQEAKVLLEELL